MKISKVLLCLLLIITSTAFLVGCSNFTTSSKKSYIGDNDISSEISELKIEWYKGSIEIESQNVDKISISETYDGTIKNSKKMRTKLVNDSLHIQYAKHNFSSKNDIKKDLHIIIPNDLTIEQLIINGKITDTNIYNISSKIIKANNVKGEMRISGCIADKIDITCLSGDFVFEKDNSVESILVNTSSANINMNVDSVNEIEANTNSGDITVRIHNVNSITTSTNAGNTIVAFDTIPPDAYLDSFSGDIKAFVPRFSDFTAYIHTKSDVFETDLPLEKNEKVYVYGTGKNSLTLDSSSGNIELKGID